MNTKNLKVNLCLDCEEPISPKATRCGSCAAKANWARASYRKNQSVGQKAPWQDPEYRRERLKIVQSTAVREKISNQVRKRWKTEDFRRKMSEVRKTLWQNPAYRQKIMATLTSPEYRRRQSELQSAIYGTPQARNKKAKDTRSLWRNPGYRRRMIEAFRVAKQKKSPAKKPISGRNEFLEVGE